MYLYIDFFSPSCTNYTSKLLFKNTIKNKYPTTTINGIKVFDKLYIYGVDNSYYDTYKDVLKLLGVYDFHLHKQNKHLKKVWLYNSIYTEKIKQFRLSTLNEYYETIDSDKVYTTHADIIYKYTESNITTTLESHTIHGMSPVGSQYKTTLFLSILKHKTSDISDFFEKLNTTKNMITERYGYGSYVEVTNYVTSYKIKEYDCDYFSITKNQNGSYFFKLKDKGIELINQYLDEISNMVGNNYIINSFISNMLFTMSVFVGSTEIDNDLFVIKTENTLLGPKNYTYLKYDDTVNLNPFDFYNTFSKTITSDYSQKKRGFFSSFLTFIVIATAIVLSGGTASALGVSVLTAITINLTIAMASIYMINRIGVWTHDSNMRYFMNDGLVIIVDVQRMFAYMNMIASIASSLTAEPTVGSKANTNWLVTANKFLKYFNLFEEMYVDNKTRKMQSKINEYGSEIAYLQNQLTNDINVQFGIYKKYDTNFGQELSERLQANIYNSTQGLIDSYTRMY